MLGNGNKNNANKGSNYAYEYGVLVALNNQLKALEGISVDTNDLAQESTLLSVLNAILDGNQDIEVLLVRDKGNNDQVIQQLTDYTKTPYVVSYIDVNGNEYVPVGPLEYIDTAGVLNLILAEVITGSKESTQLQVEVNTGNLNSQARTQTKLNTSTAGLIPSGTLNGTLMNTGEEDGLFDGVVIPPGISISWGGVGMRDTYQAMSYDPTIGGTNFLIEYTV